MLTRFEDWSSRLEAAIDAARGAPTGYAPGENHCCLFSGDLVLAMTGTDVMAWFRGRYKNERGAYLALKRHAGAGLEKTVEKISVEFQVPEVPVNYAQRGDWVLHDEAHTHDLGAGICVGSRFVTVLHPAGVVFLPMSKALRAWRI